MNNNGKMSILILSSNRNIIMGWPGLIVNAVAAPCRIRCLHFSLNVSLLHTVVSLLLVVFYVCDVLAGRIMYNAQFQLHIYRPYILLYIIYYYIYIFIYYTIRLLKPDSWISVFSFVRVRVCLFVWALFRC